MISHPVGGVIFFPHSLSKTPYIPLSLELVPTLLPTSPAMTAASRINICFIQNPDLA